MPPSLVAAVAGVMLAAVAAAHWVQPREVIARLSSPELRIRYHIVGVAQDPKLPRLMLIRVGPKWHELPADQRVDAAEQWQHLWRDSTPGGIVAILDGTTDAPLVNFDAEGRATLKEPTRSGGKDDRPAQ